MTRAPVLVIITLQYVKLYSLDEHDRYSAKLPVMALWNWITVRSYVSIPPLVDIFCSESPLVTLYTGKGRPLAVHVNKIPVVVSDMFANTLRMLMKNMQNRGTSIFIDA